MKIEEIVVSFTPDTKKLDKSLKRVEKQLKGFGKIGKANNKIFGDFLRLAGFAGLTKMTMDAAHFAHSMQVLGQQTGIATDKLSKMSSVWKVWGTDAKALATFSKRLASDIAGRKTGAGSPFYSAFRSIGIDPLTKTGDIKDLRSLFGEMADYVQKQKAKGLKEWEITSILEKTFGMPPEVASRLMGGKSAWYQYYDETASRVGDITPDEMKTLDEGLQQLNEALENYSIAIKKSAAGILGFLQEKGIISSVSNFVKENPTTSLIGTALAARYAIPMAKAAWKAPSLMAKAITSPFLTVPFGLYATGMEISGRNIAGQKRNTEGDLASKTWENILLAPKDLRDYNYRAYKRKRYEKILEGLGSRIGGQYTLDYEKTTDEILKNVGFLRYLRGYSGDERIQSEISDYLGWLADTQRAERMGNSSYEFKQENTFYYNGNMDKEMVDYSATRTGEEMSKANKTIYNAMSGVAN